MNQAPVTRSSTTALRWMALVAVFGVIVTLALTQTAIQGPWATLSLVFTLLALLVISALFRATQQQEQQLGELIEKVESRTTQIQALQTEIGRHNKLEAALMQTKHEAEAAVMAKGEFLATMSHEIRTPLNGIIPMLDLLATSRLAVDQQEILKTAITSAQQLLRIVDDILDYSKLEANRLELETTSFNLRELLQSVITLLGRQAEIKKLHLTLYIDPAVRLPVRGDPIRLRQVLSNLISNAIKFTDRGGITVNVKRIAETGTHHQLRIEVQDTGIGIDPAVKDKLFQPFSQADASTTRLYGGTGLGLVISQRIISLMDGKIGVDSQPGLGSTFWFEIALLKTQGDISTRIEDLSGGRVLLISTDQRLRSRLSLLLPNWGMQISAVENTHDALEMLRQAHAQSGKRAFSIVLADLGSIRSTAVSLSRNLARSEEYGTLRLLYIRGEETLSVELPQDVQLLPRSIADNDLRNALAFAKSPAASSVEATSNDTGSALPRKPRLLLVEDNQVNQMVAQRVLLTLGVDCDCANNGQEALEKMQMTPYDMVFMDCQMPVLDGYSATRRWREIELERGGSNRRLPIVAMTANAMAGDRQKCLDAGMDDYLTKPVARHVLEQSITRWAYTQHTATDLSTAADSPQPAADPAADPAAQSAPARLAVIDRSTFNDLCEVLGDEANSIVRIYLEDAERQVIQLQQAVMNNDLEQLRAIAHSLKSSSANIGAMQLSNSVRDLEHGLRDHSLTRPAPLVIKIANEFAQVKAALKHQVPHHTAPGSTH